MVPITGLCVHDTDSAMTNDSLDNGGSQHHIDDQSQTRVDTASHRLLETSRAQLRLHLTANERPNTASKHQVHRPQNWRFILDVEAENAKKDCMHSCGTS